MKLILIGQVPVLCMVPEDSDRTANYHLGYLLQPLCRGDLMTLPESCHFHFLL